MREWETALQPGDVVGATWEGCAERVLVVDVFKRSALVRPVDDPMAQVARVPFHGCRGWDIDKNRLLRIVEGEFDYNPGFDRNGEHPWDGIFVEVCDGKGWCGECIPPGVDPGDESVWTYQEGESATQPLVCVECNYSFPVVLRRDASTLAEWAGFALDTFNVASGRDVLRRYSACREFLAAKLGDTEGVDRHPILQMFVAALANVAHVGISTECASGAYEACVRIRDGL